MHRQGQVCHHRSARFACAWLLRAVPVAVYLLLTIAVSAQTNVDALLGEARTAEKRGDYDGAAHIYEHALTVAPGNLEVLKRLGVLEQTELKFDDSIAHFRQVLAVQPKYPEVNFFLGVSYFGKNDFPNAIESFHRELTNS
jgi:tetratricopeptide (TPR) repeat protein